MKVVAFGEWESGMERVDNGVICIMWHITFWLYEQEPKLP